MNSIQTQLKLVKKASRSMADINTGVIKQTLLDLADQIIKNTDEILVENKKDLDRMSSSDPRFDRLKLTEDRLESMANDIRKVATLESPLGIQLEHKKLENGLDISKITVPLGVVGVIYEARPNVTADVFTLCFKSGNACVLKGGSDAEFSNKKIVQLIKIALLKNNIDENILYLAPADRESVGEILAARTEIDVMIPRGSQSLISFVRENAKMPVIETGAGIVHTYFDESGDIKKGKNIIFNEKTRRPSVCNSLDTLIVHQSRLPELGELVLPLLHYQVEIQADLPSYQALKGHYDEDYLRLANDQSFGTEFLDYKMSVKTVANLDEALDHIACYSSRHSEAIIAEDKNVIQRFLSQVDAACVYANASTAFTDGAQFGLGAEIGISTQKLHARGPMALHELTSYKWIVYGNGQIRT